MRSVSIPAAPVSLADTSAAAVDGRERARRWIVRLTLATIVLLIVEGALRKWVLPTQGKLLFFVRDPLVMTVYALALANGWWPRRRALLTTAMGLAALCVPLALLQIVASSVPAGTQAMIAVYGWRNYFFYIPLMFVMAETFRGRDVAKAAGLMLLIVVPIAVLVFAQFFSPKTAIINAGIADDVAFRFKPLDLIGGRIRPAGPFSSDAGLREFNVLVLAIALAAWILPRARRAVPSLLLLAGTGAVLASLAMSGSRGGVLHAGVVAIAAVSCAGVMRASIVSLRAVLVPLVLLVGAVYLYPILLPAGHEAFTGRWTAAARAEAGPAFFGLGVFGRFFYNFFDFMFLLPDAPLLGYGLGLGGNARLVLGIELKEFQGWAENDWSRHIVDLGPVLGIAYIAFRVALTGWLFFQALRALRRRGDPLPMLLVAAAGFTLLSGQITGQGTVNGFAWIFSGLALAAARGEDRAEKPQASPTVRYPNLLR